MDKSKKSLKKQYLETQASDIPRSVKDDLIDSVDSYIRNSNIKDVRQASKEAIQIIDNAKTQDELFAKLPELFPKNARKEFTEKLQKNIELRQPRDINPERFSQIKQRFGEIDKLDIDPEQKTILKKYERARVNALPYIDEGGYSRVYDAGEGKVIKMPHPMEPRSKEDLIKKYITPKKLGESDLVEKAQLGVLPNKDVFLMDKKLTPIRTAQRTNEGNLVSLHNYYKDHPNMPAFVEEIEKKAGELGFDPYASDLKPQNIGLDIHGKPKIIDTGNLTAKSRNLEGRAIEGAIHKSAEKLEENLPNIAKNIKKTGKGFQLLKAMVPLSMLQQGVSAIADIKEGKPNTAAAKIVTGMAPPGAGELEDKLMEEAERRDKYPYLQDPTYQRTLKNIGERRKREGKSPIVEGFHGEQVDTSATEGSMFENLIKKMQDKNRQG